MAHPNYIQDARRRNAEMCALWLGQWCGEKPNENAPPYRPESTHTHTRLHTHTHTHTLECEMQRLSICSIFSPNAKALQRVGGRWGRLKIFFEWTVRVARQT